MITLLRESQIIWKPCKGSEHSLFANHLRCSIRMQYLNIQMPHSVAIFETLCSTSRTSTRTSTSNSTDTSSTRNSTEPPALDWTTALPSLSPCPTSLARRTANISVKQNTSAHKTRNLDRKLLDLSPLSDRQDRHGDQQNLRRTTLSSKVMTGRY